MSAQSQEKILEVRNLCTNFYTQYGKLKAVNNLSYHINKGECLGLVGESACGKSVSAMSVLRLIPNPPGLIENGEIIFKGEDLLKVSEKRMREIRGNRIAVVFQEPTTSLNPVLTIGRQLSESLELHKSLSHREAISESIRLLKLVGIPEAESRVKYYPHQFSGGMQQRIMIAMALCCDPELIIADEPTTSLDVTVQAQILEILAKLRAEAGVAVLIITHNLGIVARYVDRVNVMYAGCLVESGLTEEIYSRPAHPYTMGLLASVPRMDKPEQKNLRIIKGLPPNLANLPPGCAFSPRCEYATEKCFNEKPVFKQIGDEHFSACHFDRDKIVSKTGSREDE